MDKEKNLELRTYINMSRESSFISSYVQFSSKKTSIVDILLNQALVD